MGQKQIVPFLDLGLQHRGLRSRIDAAIGRTIDSSEFVLGSALARFEDEFAAYCEVPHAVGVGSGTAALHLTLLALGVGPGDEVVTVPNTFIATIEAIRYTGATPVLADVDNGTWCLSPEAFERVIGPRTRAVIPVHLYGQPCEMEAIADIADRRGIAVVEDACQAHGAMCGGRRTGNLGRAAAFSFYPTKNLGAIGDGGAVTTADGELAATVRSLRHHAQRRSNEYAAVGFNERLDCIQAAVLSVKLGHLDSWNARRRAIAMRYRDGLAGAGFVFQSSAPDSVPVYHILAARHRRRDEVLKVLTDAGIGFGRHIVKPAHWQPAYRELDPGDGSLKNSESLSRELVSLPVFPELTDGQVEYVVSALAKCKTSV